MGYFDGLNLGEAFKALQPPEPKAPGLVGAAVDTSLSVARGAVQGTKMLSDAFGAGNPVSDTLQRGIDWLSDNFSDHAKWEQLTSAQDQKAAALSGSTWEEVKAAARSFAKRPVDFLAEAAGTAVPTIAAAFLPLGQGALLGRVAMMGMGAAQGAGAVKGQIHQTVQDAWLQAGATPAEARERADAAQEYFGSNAGQIALGTALGALAGGTGVEAGVLGARAGVSLPASEAAAAAPVGIMARAAARTPRFVRDGLKESLPEAAQGGQEQLAANLALGNEGFETPALQGVAGNAVLEGLAGGAFGAGASPLTRAPARSTRETSNQGMRELATATTVDEMVNAAMKAADVPLDGGLSQEQEAQALDSLDKQAKADLDSIRQAGRMMPLDAQRRSGAPMPTPGPDPTAAVVDEAPFADRVLTLREQIADPSVRDALRALDPRAFELVHQYASIADRPDVNLPEKTRERILGLAEGIVSRAIAQPLPTAAPAPSAIRTPAGPALPSSRALPALELDTTPTGAIRVDSRGSAAPETRADVISTRQRLQQSRERRDGMTAQVTGRPLPRDFELQGEGTLTTPARPVRPAPLQIAMDNALDERAHAAATSPTNELPEPTQAQKEAGNYAKGHIRVAGLDISVENPAGSKRSGVDEDGKPWENELAHHYGYIRRTTGADGEHVDAFVKPGTPPDYKGPVFIVDQVNPKTGAFDEHKVIIGANGRQDAEAIYRANYAPDWKGLKAIKGMTMPAFKKWLAGDTTRPVGTAKDRVTEAAPQPAPAAPADPNALPAAKLAELVELSGRTRQDVAQMFTALVTKHGRKQADAMLDKALEVARAKPKPPPAEPEPTAEPTAQPKPPAPADAAAPAPQPQPAPKGETAAATGAAAPEAALAKVADLNVERAQRKALQQEMDALLAQVRELRSQGRLSAEDEAAMLEIAQTARDGRDAGRRLFQFLRQKSKLGIDMPIGDSRDAANEQAAEPAAAPAAPPTESAADKGSADDVATSKGGATRGDARPAELIALRKREAVLKRLKECLTNG